MRKTLRPILTVAALLVAALPMPARAGDGFCRGYEAGYKRGYCSNHGGQMCIPPIPPICPIPNVGENSFQDGYDRGFQDGASQ
jgi:hypothetical protein